MTQKDYILIANKLKEGLSCLQGEKEKQGFQYAITCIMQAFVTDNEKFSAQKFKAYLKKA